VRQTSEKRRGRLCHCNAGDSSYRKTKPATSKAMFMATMKQSSDLKPARDQSWSCCEGKGVPWLPAGRRREAMGMCRRQSSGCRRNNAWTETANVGRYKRQASRLRLRKSLTPPRTLTAHADCKTCCLFAYAPAYDLAMADRYLAVLCVTYTTNATMTQPLVASCNVMQIHQTSGSKYGQRPVSCGACVRRQLQICIGQP